MEADATTNEQEKLVIIKNKSISGENKDAYHDTEHANINKKGIQHQDGNNDDIDDDDDDVP